MKKENTPLVLNSEFQEFTSDSEHVFSGELLQVYRDRAVLPDASIGTREWIKHPGACAIVALTDGGECLLIQQYRYPVRQLFWEVPAGKIDRGEDPLQTAKRELSEETGWSAEKWEYVGHFYPAIGYADEVIHVYLATHLIQGTQHTDADEFVGVYQLGFQEAMKMVYRGQINDAKTMASLMRVDEYLNQRARHQKD
jgi:ADP-ribose pyrophosphatase